MSGVVVQAGDSIGVGLGANDWAAIDHLGFAPEVTIHNVSASGKAMEAGFGNREAELFVFRSTTGPSVLLIQQGTNDLNYGTNAELTYGAILIPFVVYARRAGFYVVVDTLLPRADGGWTAAKERERLAYNAMVRRNDAGADAINDLAADPVMGDTVNPATSPYYADALHPSLAGQQRLAVLNAAVLGPLLYRYPRKPG
jgi:lysophospholipase L1-like esterase